jgi:hypothetical protein
MVFKDRVKEITRTVGTVDYDVDGAYATFQGFNAFTDGDETYYCCDDGTNCEIGKGTISSSGTKISRDEIVFSTNDNNLVDWPVGDKTIFCVFPSTEIMGLIGAIGIEGIMSAIDSELGSTNWRTGGGSTLYSVEDPTSSTNPGTKEVLWVNTTTGNMFTCIDSTVDANVWKKIGSSVSVKITEGVVTLPV